MRIYLLISLILIFGCANKSSSSKLYRLNDTTIKIILPIGTDTGVVTPDMKKIWDTKISQHSIQ